MPIFGTTRKFVVSFRGGQEVVNPGLDITARKIPPRTRFLIAQVMASIYNVTIF
jgi:hypothetical protein